MSTHSKDGREWARLSALKPGMSVRCDGGFDCGIQNRDNLVGRDKESGKLFVSCQHGKHFLDGQLASETGGATDHLVGIWPA